MPSKAVTAKSKVKIAIDYEKINAVLEGTARMKRTNVSELSQAVMLATGGPVKWVAYLMELMNATESEAQKIKISSNITQLLLADSQINAKDKADVQVDEAELLKQIGESAEALGLIVPKNGKEDE